MKTYLTTRRSSPTREAASSPLKDSFGPWSPLPTTTPPTTITTTAAPKPKPAPKSKRTRMRVLSPPLEPHIFSVEMVSKHPLPPIIHTHYCPGHETGRMYPDFIISGIYPDGNGGYTRKILSITEVKRDNSASSRAFEQLSGYIDLAGRQSHDEILRSVISGLQRIRNDRIFLDSGLAFEAYRPHRFNHNILVYKKHGRLVATSLSLFRIPRRSTITCCLLSTPSYLSLTRVLLPRGSFHFFFFFISTTDDTHHHAADY